MPPSSLLALSDASLAIVPDSVVAGGGASWGLARTPDGPRLVVAPDAAPGAPPPGFVGARGERAGRAIFVGPVGEANAAVLRRSLSWLVPRPLPPGTSAGFGDRMGVATPGHVRALRAVGAPAVPIAPIFAQQSIREMSRSGRTPQAVIDDATWGAFEAGWTAGVGADADHLKTPADVDACAAAGFSFFTIDPGAFVNDRAEAAPAEELRQAFDALPWDRLESSGVSLRRSLAGRVLDVDGHRVPIDEAAVVKAAVKYGAAVAHVAMMYRHLASVKAGEAFDLEVSVDETDTPTSHAEHVYIASELQRLGVRWISLAPRFVGRFEKGVDYIGDVEAFESDIATHAAIARHFGSYKLSLHSGSDKFSIYEIAARHTRGSVHLKTAGTSYLEALRAVARVAPDLFRAVYAFSRDRYEEDRASYHVSARLDRTPEPAALASGDVAGLLDQFDARQVLHVTFGSVLTARDAAGAPLFADAVLALLKSHPEVYAECLERHFARHLRPFVRS
ncbi:MAG TPA: tagaturonate epimerase family protein [Vicinamibacterales bacterium]|nr:tagaturonate epimerase family protein [Vicinamibacterales bacterium]HOQ59072.1 tagaturonate epimerase family protein [Vicinamibacterales bacterium]HPK70485.1 tagaturonate epimerase family protein [Vicinamibacterales bacterium]